MLIYGAFKDENGKEKSNLYSCYEDFFNDTFSPLCEVLSVIEFRLHGKTYHEKATAARDLAVEYSLTNYPGLSWGEVAKVQGYFEKIGRRYGLLNEFRENCIC